MKKPEEKNIRKNMQKSSEPVNKKPAERGKKTSSIYVVMYSFVFLFLGMIAYLCLYVKQNGQDLLNNSYNTRQKILLAQNYRGSIYASGGEVLAETEIKNGAEERKYPYGNLFSHVVGYSTRGKVGVEAQANAYLIQSNIPLSEKVINETTGAKNPGDNVYTTLQVPVQEAASKALDNYRGAVIVTEVKTGKVIAMVSKPDFDPGTIAADWDKLSENTDSAMLMNRATQGLYPPGSTFKIVTALCYMRQHPEEYASYTFNCPGYFKTANARINCYHGTSHGQVDFTESFAKSCNSSFANMGMQIDREMFEKTVKELSFNEKLPVSFLYSQSRFSFSEEFTDAERLQAAIGQGTTVMTPLHLNMITQAIANGGVMMKPYLIDYVASENGTVIKKFSPEEYKRVMTTEESEALTELMKAVVEEGTAKKVSGMEFTVAGKTGSAEYGQTKGESHAWFTGFAPAEDPEIAVTIIVEGAGSGGDYAVPMAKRIFRAYFEQEN